MWSLRHRYRPRPRHDAKRWHGDPGHGSSRDRHPRLWSPQYQRGPPVRTAVRSEASPPLYLLSIYLAGEARSRRDATGRCGARTLTVGHPTSSLSWSPSRRRVVSERTARLVVTTVVPEAAIPRHRIAASTQRLMGHPKCNPTARQRPIASSSRSRGRVFTVGNGPQT
jgi:hypothetical protein